jgi:hypothetical protein
MHQQANRLLGSAPGEQAAERPAGNRWKDVRRIAARQRSPEEGRKNIERAGDQRGEQDRPPLAAAPVQLSIQSRKKL